MLSWGYAVLELSLSAQKGIINASDEVCIAFTRDSVGAVSSPFLIDTDWEALVSGCEAPLDLRARFIKPGAS